ncbi:MAG: hypothetical protein JJ850_09085 [Kordiimonadaceae bacterium]|nr:hypothetical protein [Kordiimonadaceae bacterium]MBO6569283.1 hypothetical protein [Kordiimonadaceae bacterium]MBO6964759.1 hypothetical protein [Kordiimonadaceae bacterium]
MSGRGDDLPASLVQQLDSKDLAEIGHLVELVVEIGIVDMYGTTTKMPLKLAEKCREFLHLRGGAVQADLGIDVDLEGPSNAWGNPLAKDKFKIYQSILANELG